MFQLVLTSSSFRHVLRVVLARNALFYFSLAFSHVKSFKCLCYLVKFHLQITLVLLKHALFINVTRMRTVLLHLVIFQKNNCHLFRSSFGIFQLQFSDWYIHLEILPILPWIFAYLCKKAIKTPKKKIVKFAQVLFYQPSGCLKANFGPMTRSSLTHWILTTTLFQVQPESHLEPHNESWSQSLIERNFKI